MKFTQNDHKVEVTLSRRNLLSLLAKLYQEGSHRTLEIPTDDGRVLSVSAEPDEIHYVNRRPGPVSGETYAILRQVEIAAEQVSRSHVSYDPETSDLKAVA